MENPSSNVPFPNLPRVKQKTSSHCGPAVLEMLLGYLGEEIDQEKFVEASGVGKRLKNYGMTVKELARAVKKLAPEYNFWYKEDATMSELAQIVEGYKYPVGVEWQGLFDCDEDGFEDETEDEDDSTGHYSVVTHVDTINNLIRLADPYQCYAGRDRAFTIREFEGRWWDENEEIDPVTGSKKDIFDYHMMIVITPKDITFPGDLTMLRG
jgi:hypothetical protein